MSQENVEVVKAGFDAWNSGDMDAFRAMYDPGVVGRAPEDWPEQGPFVGREAVMRQFMELRGTWDTTFVELHDVIDAADRVLVRYTFHGRGRGPDYDLATTVVCTMRKGRIVMQEFFWHHADALEAVGLSEQDAHADSP